MSVAESVSLRTADRTFYVGMAVASTATVFAGFAGTYYLKAYTGAPPLPPLVHVHGAVFTLWMLLFLAQTTLVAAGRTDVHRRLGVAGAFLAAAMVVLGYVTAVESARGGRNPNPAVPDALAFMLVPLGDILIFSVLVAAALHHRRRPETHKRLMLLATTGGLLVPAVGRLPGMGGAVPAILGITALFVLAGPIHDLVTARRIHRANLWGALFVLGSFPARLAIAPTEAWHQVARWLVG